MASLKQNTARNRAFLLVATSDHISGLAGATVVVSINKNATTNFNTAGATIVELGYGWYAAKLTTSDTNTLGDLAFHAIAASADPTDWVDEICANILGDTLPANTTQWNGTNVAAPATAGIPEVNVKNINNQAATTGATNLLQIDVEAWDGVTIAEPATDGIPDVNVKNIVNVAAALDANNLLKVDVEDIRGTVSPAAAGSVAPDWGQVQNKATANVLSGTTIGTLTTYTGNTVQTGDSFARLGAPAGASVSADIAEVEGETDTLLAGVIVTTNNDKTGYTVSTNSDKTGYSLAGTVTTGTILGTAMDALLQRQLTESYAALHTVPSLTQAILEMRGHHSEKSISATSVTIFQVDGATAAEVFSLNNTSPTSITRNA